jgi:mannose-6-phosphate isomerase-like protein (cupin superfamily)
MTSRAHVVGQAQGRSVDLGVARMRVLVDSTVSGAFSLTEFVGTAEGAWTVPHLHRGFEELFFVLDGEFTFTVGGEPVVAGPGTYVLVGVAVT